MGAIVQSILFVFLGYFGLAAFMWYFGQLFHALGYYFSFLGYPLGLINTYIFAVNDFVYLVWGALIFAIIYKIFKSVFINKK